MNLKLLLKRVNWFGLVAGVFMLALPFLGFWWVVEAGEGPPYPAARLALSPFDIETRLGSHSISTTLIEYFLLAAKIGFILGGAFMILGSLQPRSWWSRHLVRFGVMRPFWSVVMLVIMVIVGTTLINLLLPGLMSSMAAELGGEEVGEVQTEVDIPYFGGSTVARVGADSTRISAPVSLTLTGAFWFAVVVTGFGIAGRVYHRRLTPPRPER